jgi:pyruvate/2-oxoglutarate dehydrogenase complex dihydrolipoamide acyltransferase (E2) component
MNEQNPLNAVRKNRSGRRKKKLRDIITLSLTFDHRALDGAPAARFLQTLTSLIESPRATLVPGYSGRLS